jgi:hypothetical protein
VTRVGLWLITMKRADDEAFVMCARTGLNKIGRENSWCGAPSRAAAARCAHDMCCCVACRAAAMG